MKIYSSEQIKRWDQHTIKHEPITSIDLMERASLAFCQEFMRLFPDKQSSIALFCGPGNNGGDGLAVGRILHFEGYSIQIYICEIGHQFSEDFVKNKERLPQLDTLSISTIRKDDAMPEIGAHQLVIDAIFGTGLNRPVIGYWAQLLNQINQSNQPRVSIDIPSGLPADGIVLGDCIQANYTISFERPKQSFFLSENDRYVGKWSIVEIGLDQAFEQHEKSHYYFSSRSLVQKIKKNRDTFGHKGTYGHALLITGSYGMMGAAQLCTKACLRSGAGLVSNYIPRSGYPILQSTCPEAMTLCDPDNAYITQIPNLKKYKAIGIGPGIGQYPQTQKALVALLEEANQPLVIDADALNFLASEKELLKKIPKNSILTPHPGEFNRLFGKTSNDLEALTLLRNKSIELQTTIILKGAYSRISFPSGEIYFNCTGNPGMATGGSGDVLTGILTGLLAQGYTVAEAALLGVFLHGSAGDIACQEMGQEAMLASDIIRHLGNAFLSINSNSST